MADLALGVARSVVEGTLTKAQSAIEEEVNLRQGAQRDLVFITGEFQMMQSFLRVVVVDEERAKNLVVRAWVGQVRDLAYDVEDCIELVAHLDNKSDWWRRLLPGCIVAVLPLDKAVAEIKQLKARVEDVSHRCTHYGLTGIIDFSSRPMIHEQPAPSAVVSTAARDSFVVRAWDTAKRQPGLVDLTQLIVKRGGELRVISVWGHRCDDLGTISVIRKAYDDPEVCQTFGCRGWVKLQYPFNPRKFLQSVVAQFYTNSCLQRGKSIDLVELERMESTGINQGGFVEELKNQVDKKRYLLVLENVCTMGDWDAIRACLPESDNGNQIIVSTVQREIARLCIGHSYQVLELMQYSADYPICVFLKKVTPFRGMVDKDRRVVLGCTSK